MSSRIAMLAAAGFLAAACASNPAAAPSAPSSPGTASSPTSPTAPAGTVTVSNVAATTSWMAEEKLIPEDPVLALVNAGAMNTDNPVGIAVMCKAANGSMAMHLGKQPATRVGQAATFRLRAGPGVRDIAGTFVTNPRSPDADFVFPVSSADLLALGQLDMISFVTDQGDVQWAFVKDAGAQVQATYIGSLKNYSSAARDFLNYCNPK
jgi:hypothetical protein